MLLGGLGLPPGGSWHLPGTMPGFPEALLAPGGPGTQGLPVLATASSLGNPECDWRPHKKRRSGHSHTLRDNHVGTQGEKTAVRTPRREASGGASPAHTWISDSSLRDRGTHSYCETHPRLACVHPHSSGACYGHTTACLSIQPLMDVWAASSFSTTMENKAGCFDGSESPAFPPELWS